MALDMVAVTGGKPKAMRVGNVISVPDPTTVLIVPAPTPARKMAMISTVLTPAPYGGPDPGPARVSRFVGCSPLCSPTRSAVRAFRARFIALSELARERGPARSWRQSGQWVRDCSSIPAIGSPDSGCLHTATGCCSATARDPTPQTRPLTLLSEGRRVVMMGSESAEAEGFEPPRLLTPGRFHGGCLRPLGHASAAECRACLLYTSDAADEEDSVDLGG